LPLSYTLNFPQASDDAMRLTLCLNGKVGSAQRPHQKEQSMQ